MTLILGIETSCDETAAAVVRDGCDVLSNDVATQHDLHERYRGVVPEIASRAHVEAMLPCLRRALHDANVTWNDLDAVAVGNRPGLIGSLVVGVAAAKAIALAQGIPLIGVDHVRAHLDAWRLVDSDAAFPSQLPTPNSQFPHLGLVVSGGHTHLFYMPKPGTLITIGHTIDDAVGEAFDKAATILDLPYPGGPNLDQLAEHGDPNAHRLPRSLLAPDSLDFSYSGLKTALLYAVRGQPVGKGKDATFHQSAADHNEKTIADFAASFRAAAIAPILTKLKRALKRYPDTTALIVGGGVSANTLLRRELEAFSTKHNLPVAVPPMRYCTDNAAMIAAHAHARLIDNDTDPLDLPAMASSSLV